MEILIFISGFMLGAITIAITSFFLKKLMIAQMNLHFENTANKVIKMNSENFTEQNSQKLEEFFTRFKDKIEDFQKRAEANYKDEREKLTQFDTNIKHFIEAGNKISQETINLINAMKTDNKTTGKWGEIVLERVLEASGLRKNEDFFIQKGNLEGIPDATVNLPDNRKIFIDSKTSFSSWYNYVNSKSAEEKNGSLKEFIASTKSHISGLAKRNYAIEEGSPDYILMFIPIEGCYSLFFCDDCFLWDFAWKNKVMPVSPSTLLAALKIINTFHQIDRQNKNIMEMAKLCTSIHDKFCDLLCELLNIRKNLDNSLKKLEGHGNIIKKLEKLEELGINAEKQIPEIRS